MQCGKNVGRQFACRVDARRRILQNRADALGTGEDVRALGRDMFLHGLSLATMRVPAKQILDT